VNVIIITGPKHSGKTSAGLALIKLLSGTGNFRQAADSAEPCFADLDELIEQRTGKSPRTLYKEGREIFQKAEAEALAFLVRKAVLPFSSAGGAAVCGSDPANAAPPSPAALVIAAGGGIIDNEQALALIKKTSGVIPVFLDVSADTAWERINASARLDGELPPFLKTENPGETHQTLHEQRAAAYRKLARIIIEADGKSPEEIAGEIVFMLGKPEFIRPGPG
jgi:shikimate kinase